MGGERSGERASLPTPRCRGRSGCRLCRLNGVSTDEPWHRSGKETGDIPWLSSEVSISACVRPKSLHSLMWRLISCRIWVTIAAAYCSETRSVVHTSSYYTRRDCILPRCRRATSSCTRQAHSLEQNGSDIDQYILTARAFIECYDGRGTDSPGSCNT